MATTDSSSLSSLQKTVWDKMVAKQGRDENFLMSNGFIGNSLNSPIYKCTELTETERGSRAVLPLVADLTGGGVVGDNELDGNEEALIHDSQTIQIDQIRNGVKSRGKMSEQKTVIRFRVQAKDALAFWLADAIDELGFLTMSGRAYTLNTDGSTRGTSQWPSLSFAADVAAASTNRIVYAGSATSEGTLTSADKMSWDLIIKAKAVAKRKRIPMIRAGGRGYYAVAMSTEQWRDLSSSADYKTLTAQAMPRGTDNPLFTNAKRVIDDVVLYDHQKVFNTLGLSSGSKWGSGGLVDGAQAILMGAGALGYAQIDSGSAYNESTLTDYNNRMGIGIGRIIGWLKPQFKSRFDSQSREDYGVLSIKTAAAA